MNRRVFRGPAWYPFNAPLEAQAASIPSKSSLPPDYPRPPRPASRYRRPLALIPVSSASSTITTAALCSVSLPSGLDPERTVSPTVEPSLCSSGPSQGFFVSAAPVEGGYRDEHLGVALRVHTVSSSHAGVDVDAQSDKFPTAAMNF
mmetsp:Transcript_12920/g.30540  ORF Transcript_12920/g.30540 Transcript_12920/m.30540 type:complete len:147 (+) Transcript_12920:260-700(+)